MFWGDASRSGFPPPRERRWMVGWVWVGEFHWGDLVVGGGVYDKRSLSVAAKRGWVIIWGWGGGFGCFGVVRQGDGNPLALFLAGVI